MNPLLKSYSKQLIDDQDIQAVVNVLQSDFLTQGVVHDQFEEALANYVGVKYALTFNSATSALHTAYLASSLGEGDEVITTPISFAATANMIKAVGAKPVFVDVKLDGNIDERMILKAITPQTKAIVSVDFAGNPVAIAKIMGIAKEHNLKVISDSSHALGSSVDGEKVGSFADVTVFSFHAIKSITTGEGGALVTNDEEVYFNAKKIRSHGIEKGQLYNSEMHTIGFNYRMSDINAALGLSQLKKLDSFVQKRNALATIYDQAFKRSPSFYTVPIPRDVTSSRHLYPILLKPELFCPKEDIFKGLQEKGLGVQVHYKPIHKYSYYEKKYGAQRLMSAEDFFKAEISLPLHQLMNEEDVEEVIEIVDSIMNDHAYRVCRY
jgi:UDP-4-amino-4,6-dideoxy-L-N-acetyl-beta-L-altrosamine transaminase